MLRVGATPIGRVHLPYTTAGAFGGALASAITREDADRALRAVVATWLRHASGHEPFRVADAFDAAHDAVRDAVGDNARNATGIADARAAAGPPLTVAICSRDRPRLLERALNAIAPTLRPDDELLVVLNAPAHGTPLPDTSQFPFARFVVEPRPGLGWARNRAIVEFQSDLLLFTDDDCVPDAGWVPAQRMLFHRNPDVGASTGLIEPLELDTWAQQLFERYGGFARGYRRRWIHAPQRHRVAGIVGNVGEYGAGANLAVRRRVIERIGPFDAALGPGTPIAGGDDLEYLFRLLKAGELLAYEPRAMVRHEHRRELFELMAQIEGWSGGYACAMQRSMLAFPEERWPYGVMRARIALLYHARRALFMPEFRRLAFAELLGMYGASRRYAAARANAENSARYYASPAADGSPFAPRPGNASDGRRTLRPTSMAVDLESVEAPLVPEHAADLASVTVRFRGRALGTVTLPVLYGAVGADRLRDHVLDQLGDAIIDGAWDAAVRDTHERLLLAARAMSGRATA